MFEKYDKGEIDSLGSKYDYSSVMHYGSKAFSRNNQDTIRVRQKNVTAIIGQRKGLSKLDAQQIQKLYKCENGENRRLSFY